MVSQIKILPLSQVIKILSVERYNQKRRDTEFEVMSQALHLGNTAQHAQIQHVSTKAKIVTVTADLDPNKRPTSSAVFINFNGNFTNCQFFFPKNDV